MKRFVGYVRVSSEEQHKEGISPEYQARKIREYAGLHDGEVLHIYSDLGKSGGSIKGRKEFQKMLEHARRNRFDSIVFLRIDRFSRNSYDVIRVFNELKDTVSIVSIQENLDTTTATGKAIMSILAVLGSLEREWAQERTNNIHLMKIEQGMPISPPPFGYRWKKKRWVVDEEEAAKVREIFSLVAMGVPPADVLKDFNISQNHIYRILKNKAYLGRLVYRGRDYEGDHQPLVSADTWNAAHRQYRSNMEVNNP